MGKRQSIKPEPDREEPEVDLEPIRRVYDAATNMLKLGRRWLSALEPEREVKHPASAKVGWMFCTFFDTVFPLEDRQIGGGASSSAWKKGSAFPDKFIKSRRVKIFISRNRPLSDALRCMSVAWAGLFAVLSWPLMGMTTDIGVFEFRMGELEKARNLLGEVLDDLEADETPLDLARRLKHSISGGELSPCGERLRDRLELILAVFKDHGPGPFRAKRIAKLAVLHPDSHLRADLSTLMSLEYLKNDGRGYIRTDKPYPMS